MKTVVSLAKLTLPPEPKIERIGDAALLRIREQARLQVQGRDEGQLIYELIEGVEDTDGLAALPSPSSGDMFLDLESNPYVLDQGLEYLFGIVALPISSSDEPTYDLSALSENIRETCANSRVSRLKTDRRKNRPRGRTGSFGCIFSRGRLSSPVSRHYLGECKAITRR